MSAKRIIVIGSGISGISAAIKTKELGYEVLVLEKSSKSGGIIDSYKNKVNIELGAHSFYNSYQNCLSLIKKTQFQSQIVEKEKLPFLFDDSGNFISIFKKLHNIPMAIGMLKWYMTSRVGKSVSQHYSKIFGKRNYASILKYCFNAVLSQNAQDFPADLLFKVKKRDKNFPRCFGFKNGMASFIDHLVSFYQLDIKYDIQIERLEQSDHKIIVESNLGKLEADKLIIACDVSSASFLLKNMNLEVARILDAIFVSKILSCAIEVNSSKLDLRRLAGIIGSQNSDYYSIVSADPFVSAQSGTRGFVIHFKYQPKLSKESLVENICMIFKINQNDILHFHTKEQSVPMLKVGHQTLVEKVDKLLFGTNIYLTGNYFNRLAVEDCVERSFSLEL